METHLRSLTDTLNAIKLVHDKPRNPSRPFTAAILNTKQLDVLDFIRDADQFESNLFWYPPAGSAVAGPSSAREMDQVIVADMDGASRKPEPRVMLPPTPLRKSAKEAEARGLVEFDARTLLKAAHRLLDNYHNAPRARKHVRSLMKKHADLQKTIRDLEESVTETDALIEQLHAKGKDLGSSLNQMKLSRSKGASSVSENADLTASIQREEMEIMALEQMIEDAQAQKKRADARKPIPRKSAEVAGRRSMAKESKVGGATPQKGRPPAPTTMKAEGAAKTPRQPSTSASAFRATLAASSRKSVAATPSRKVESLDAIPRGDETIRLEPAAAAAPQEEADNADETIRLQPSTAREISAEEAQTLASNSARRRPAEASDELESVCENIWRIFGDHLRYAAPHRESAEYLDTLDILQSLSVGAQRSNSHDASFASEATAATSGSTVGNTSNLTNLGVPSPLIALDSYVLSLMLRSSPPHAMELEGLYQEADRWWSEEGRSSYQSNTGANDAELAETTQSEKKTLGHKAVYDLVAKKLLRIRFGKSRIISFSVRV